MLETSNNHLDDVAFVMEKKDPLLVNYRVKHSIYIVDRLFDRAQLRVGPKSAVDIRCTRLIASR